MNSDTTLSEAKNILRNNWEKGISCPCCGQFVKQYRRKLNAGMAYTLIKASKLTGDLEGWVHVNQMRATTNDYPYLRYWGLLEEKTKNSEVTDKKNSGYWRVTLKGRLFINGDITVDSHIKIYNSQFYGFDGEQVTIKNCLGNKFDHKELMGK